MWNYRSYIVNISSLIFPYAAHLKRQEDDSWTTYFKSLCKLQNYL